VVVPLPQLEFRKFEGEGVQLQYRRGCVSFAVEPLQLVITGPGPSSIEAGPAVGDPNHLL